MPHCSLKLTHCKVYLDLGDGWKHWNRGSAQYTAWFDYSPGRPGVHTLRNGDPGFPEDPPQMELNELERFNVTFAACLLTEAQFADAERQVWDYINEMESESDNES
jgi:hypothetical protein